LRKIPLNRVLFVPNNEALLGILDKFQEGRSHIAIVSRFSAEKAVSVKKAVKRGLTSRLRQSVGMGDSDSSTDEEGGPGNWKGKMASEGPEERNGEDATLKDEDSKTEYTVGQNMGAKTKTRRERRRAEKSKRDFEAAVESDKSQDVEKGVTQDEKTKEEQGKDKDQKRGIQSSLAILPKATVSMSRLCLEQAMPADAVLAKEGAKEVRLVLYYHILYSDCFGFSFCKVSTPRLNR
jgi:metal transporter CNNM